MLTARLRGLSARLVTSEQHKRSATDATSRVAELGSIGRITRMELFDVPEVTQLPDLSGGVESPPAFADMVLTQWLRYDCAFLYAEQPWNDLPDTGVSWRVHPRERDIFSREFEA